MSYSLESILSFLGGVFPELIGAAFGAALGYTYGLRQDRKMRMEEENKKKEAIVISILTEVADIKSIINKGMSEIRVPYPTVSVYYLGSILPTDAFDSVIYSGNLQLLEIESQRKLAWFFRGCKRMNEIGIQLEVREYNKNGAIAVKFQIKTLFEGLKEGIVDLEETLQGELSEPFEIILSRAL